jgi:hypothetical protein
MSISSTSPILVRTGLYRFHDTHLYLPDTTRLNVHDYLRQTFGPCEQRPNWERYVSRVTEKGRSDDGLNFSGVLQVCILSTPLLQTRDERQILDIRKNLPRSCINRSKLVEALADTLLEYTEKHCARVEDIQKESTIDPREILYRIDWAWLYLMIARHNEFLPATSRHLTPKKLVKIRDDVAMMLRALTPEIRAKVQQQLYRGSGRDLYYDLLLQHMCDAFQQNGPSRSRFPAQAVYHAISAILTPLLPAKATAGTTSPAAIQRRLQRGNAVLPELL